MWLFWVCWCHSLERKRRHISAILTRIFDILLIKAWLFRRQWAVSTTLFCLFTTRTDRSKRVLSQFVFKTEKSQLFKKLEHFRIKSTQTHLQIPLNFCIKIEKSEKTNTDPHKFALFSSFWHRNDNKSGSCSLAFCFSLFSVFYYFKKHTLSHSENCHFLFIRLRFSDVWVRMLDNYVTLWYIWSIFSCVWTALYSVQSYISWPGSFLTVYLLRAFKPNTLLFHANNGWFRKFLYSGILFTFLCFFC